jgi:hypothetical protein
MFEITASPRLLYFAVFRCFSPTNIFLHTCTPKIQMLRQHLLNHHEMYTCQAPQNSHGVIPEVGRAQLRSSCGEANYPATVLAFKG